MSKAEGEFSLDEQLEALTSDGKWDVLETFKQTKCESTQKVVRRASENEVKQAFIRKEFTEDSKQGEAYEKLWNEQWKGRVLKHCPKIQDWYEYGRTRVVILDYVEGETLEQYVKNNNLSNEEIKQLFMQICDAVFELHSTFEQPLIHRDLKPTNIIVSDGEVKIIDFGIARFQRGGMTPDTTQFGTPAFAPPEQYGFGETGVESDVYALGMVLYFMFTKKLSKVPLRDNPTFADEVPVEFQPVLLKATAFDPQDRFRSVKEFRETLEGVTAEPLCCDETKVSTKQIEERLDETDDVNEELRVTGESPAENFRDKNADSAGAGVFLNKARRILGRIWNFVLVTFWLLCMLAVIFIIVFPSEEAAQNSFAFRLVGYVGAIGIPFTLWGFVLLDKSRLKEKFTVLKALNWKKLILLVLAGFLSMVVAVILSAAL